MAARARQPSPVDFITVLPNLVAARYSQGVMRIQGRAHPVKSLCDEIFMPLEERTNSINAALAGSSPSYIAYANLLMLAQRGLAILPMGIATFVSRNHPLATRLSSAALGAAMFHPWQARMTHLQAIPPPLPWISPLADGVWVTLQAQRFYVRSLEPAVLRAVAHGAIHYFRVVDQAVSRLCPDPEFKDDWSKIETDLIEEDTIEPGTLDEEAVHRRLQGLYAKRFHKWFMRILTKTVLEDYGVRTVLFPIETVSVRLTCSSPNDANLSPLFLPNAFRIASKEGVAALYSGLSVALAGIVPHLATAWGFYLLARLTIAMADPAWIAGLLGFAPPKPVAEEEADEDEEEHKPAAQ